MLKTRLLEVTDEEMIMTDDEKDEEAELVEKLNETILNVCFTWII